MAYLYSVENVITLGKLIGLLFCLPSSLFFFVENIRYFKAADQSARYSTFSLLAVKKME